MNLKTPPPFSRSLVLSLGGLAFLVSFTGSRISAQTKLDVKVHVSPAANKNNPIAVDLVLVSDKKLLKELMKMSAKEWFEQRHQVQLDYPKEKDLAAGTWEWVPGQAVHLDRLPVRREIIGGIVFANYFTEGAHRAALNPRKDILLTLGEDDLCIQSAKEISKPCPTSKNPISLKPQYQHRVKGVLVWDQETLRQAITLNEQYETFMGTKSYKQLDNSVKEAARARVKAKFRNLILHARKYQTLAPSAEGSALKTGLVTEVQYLQNAQPILSRVLEISARVGVDRELRAALAQQGTHLLRDISREFVSEQFYVAKQSDFSWWDGRQPVSYVAYDLGSAEDLAGYLNVQRKNIAFLGRDLVVPVLTFFAAQNIYLQRNDSQVDWDAILADLYAFDNKTPGNPIGALEAFIRTEMDRVSIDSCSGVTRASDDRSGDYFLRIRNSLRLEFYARCKELWRFKAINDTVVELQKYYQIEKSFNDNLAGAFPFAEMDHRQLAPWAMLKFFKVLKDNEKGARDALDHSKDFGATPDRLKAAKEFLDKMDRVRDFFAPFLDKEQDPSFDFKLQLRVNREQEIGANQIIDWKLEVGKKKFTYASDDLTGHWIYGDPVRLTLRWANDSPSLPVASALPVPFTVKERTAVFEYKDPWSLLTLLLRHGLVLKRAGVAADCDKGLDSDPYTLKFTIRTESDPAGIPGQRQDLQMTRAELFLRITLFERNKSGPIMIPCFPTTAPPVPPLFPSVPND